MANQQLDTIPDQQTLTLHREQHGKWSDFIELSIYKDAGY